MLLKQVKVFQLCYVFPPSRCIKYVEILATKMCSLLWVTLLRQRVGLGDPQRPPPTPNILWFCEICYLTSKRGVRNNHHPARITSAPGRDWGSRILTVWEDERWGQEQYEEEERGFGPPGAEALPKHHAPNRLPREAQRWFPALTYPQPTRLGELTAGSDICKFCCAEESLTFHASDPLGFFSSL